MPRLIGLAVTDQPDMGQDFVSNVQRIWADGDAFAPIDYRLPKPEIERVLQALQPSAIIEHGRSEQRLPTGMPTEVGDAVVLATSGTSGQPKGVVHTHQSVAASAHATSTALAVDQDTDKWLACLPLSHIGGLAVVLRSIVTDTKVEIHSGFNAEAVVAAAKNGATLVSLVTRALNQIPPELFRTILIGGAAPPPIKAPNVIATYGMTETGSGVIYNKTALEGLEIRLDDDSNDGEILLRGPMLFRCYRSGPDPFRADGWFPTGDLGHWGEDGSLVVRGRAADVIVTGGEKVWPGPIERLLARRADIAEVALVGRADSEWGHRIVAVVIPTDPENPPPLEAIRAQVKERFGPWSAPKEIELRSTLPKTTLGKVKKNELAESN